MLRIITLYVILIVTNIGYSQTSFFANADSLHIGRFIGVSSGVGVVWSGSMIGLSELWYDEVEKSKWHTFDDSRNWLQMDKAGHFYAAYKINQLNTELYRWTGLNRRKALWVGTGISLGYQTTFEMLDAYSADWGFSWSDVVSNTLGTLSYLTQQIVWDEERIIPKFSFAPTEFSTVRPAILGGSYGESLMKDYNGQTYWLSFSPGTFFKKSKIPKWACISVGYGVHAKLVGSEEYYLDQSTGKEYYSKREILFSLDIDFSRIPVKKQWLKVLLKQFNYVKIPFPALILRDGRILGSLTGY
jgi:uncharacterized protein YfiM (DUF2279 family)